MQEFRYLSQFNSINSKENDLKDAKGIYLWIYDFIPPRIVYIGTATGKNGLFRRLCEELEQIKIGKHYVIRLISEDGDPYDILTNEAKLSNQQLHDVYYERRSLLWIPGKDNKNYFGEKFNKSWEEYVNDVYLKKIAIYYSFMTQENAKIFEAQLQIFIKDNAKIGYYKHGRGIKKSQSWLGRPEISHDLLFKSKFSLDKKFFSQFNYKDVNFNCFEDYWENN